VLKDSSANCRNIDACQRIMVALAAMFKNKQPCMELSTGLLKYKLKNMIIGLYFS
jgi:hypothetical protein